MFQANIVFIHEKSDKIYYFLCDIKYKRIYSVTLLKYKYYNTTFLDDEKISAASLFAHTLDAKARGA